MEIKTHCPKCQAEFLTELPEPLLTELGLQRKSPEAEAKLAEETEKVAKLSEENTGLKEEVARLESQEHEDEVVAAWLRRDFENADPEVKVELGMKLGLDKMFQEAEVAEVKEPAPKPAIVYSDPHDPDYEVLSTFGCWLYKPKDKATVAESTEGKNK